MLEDGGDPEMVLCSLTCLQGRNEGSNVDLEVEGVVGESKETHLRAKEGCC